MSADFTVLSAAHHRNGVGGTPFYVGIIATTRDLGIDARPTRMHIVVVPETHHRGPHAGEPDTSVFWPSIFVLDLDVAATDQTVEFGVNSWRGDTYQAEARAIVAAA